MVRLFLAAAGLSFLVGCDAGPSGSPQADVKGLVNLNGKPMPKGQVSFFIQGEPPGTMEIVNGEFSGKARVGKNKVEIRSFTEGPPLSTDPKKEPTKINILPDRYNVASTLSAEVKAGAVNEVKFDVTSK